MCLCLGDTARRHGHDQRGDPGAGGAHPQGRVEDGGRRRGSQHRSGGISLSLYIFICLFFSISLYLSKK